MEKIGIFNDYTVIDTEYISMNGKILELGALKIREGLVVDEFQQLVNPEVDIPNDQFNVSGITNDDVKDAPTIEKAINSLYDFIGNDLVIGHNVKSADIDKINKCTLKTNLEFKNDFLCTYKMAKASNLPIEKYSLSEIGKYLGLGTEQHRALNDCKYTYHIYEILKHVPIKNIETNLPSKHNGKGEWWKKQKSYEVFNFNFDNEIVSDLLKDKEICFTNCTEYLTQDLVNRMYLCGFSKSNLSENNVRKTTSYLVYQLNKDGSTTGKFRKADSYKKKGQDINIVSIFDFIELLNKEINKNTKS